jgi:hypothetical protein
MGRAMMGLTPGDAAQLIFLDVLGDPRVAIGLNETGVANVILPDFAPADSAGGS